MLVCNYCSVWYHCDCVGLSEDEAKMIPDYKCNDCVKCGRDELIIPGITKIIIINTNMLMHRRFLNDSRNYSTEGIYYNIMCMYMYCNYYCLLLT